MTRFDLRPSGRQLLLEILESRRLLAADVSAKADGNPGLPQAIIGGIETERGEFGWVASIQQSGFGHFCGGTLVAPDAIITAAHCVEGTSANQLSVIVGRHDLNRSDDGQNVRVSQIVVSEDYNTFTNGADIAILLLDEPVDEQPIGYLTPANASLADPGVMATVLGWGTTREGGNPVSILQQVDVPIVSNATANLPASYNGAITSEMLAAGRASGGVDSCQGDSGGPLIVNDAAGTPQLAGVVSWGEGCGRPNKYGIYTRVTEFSEFIGEYVASDPLGEINFNQERYVVGSEVQILLQDVNAGEDPIEVVVTSNTQDTETVALIPYSPGRYQGSINLVDSPDVSGDGVLSVEGEGEIVVDYRDVDDGEGNVVEVSSFASIVVDDVANNAQGAEPIELATTFAGEVDVNGDVDWFQIDIEAGQGYEIAVDLESLNDSVLSIYGDAGEMLLGFDDDSGRGLGSQIIYFPDKSETLYVEVGGFNANIGTYTLLVTETDSPSDDHSNIVGGATTMDVGDSRFGVIDSPGDADLFRFEAEAGTVYRVETTLSSLEDSQLRLIGSDGRTELAFNDDIVLGFQLESQIYYRAEESGTIFVEVTGWEDEVGSYRLLVDDQADDHGNTSLDPTELGPIDSTVSDAFGEILPQDVDWFSVQLQADRFYEFRTFITSGFDGDTVLELYDASGERRLARNDDHLDTLESQIVWQAPTDGVFHVQVSAYQNTEANYRLTVRELDPAPLDDIPNRAELADIVEVPDRVGGDIQYEADEDWFRIETVAGGEYTFEVTLRTLDDSVLRLFDTDGATLLAENDDIDFPDRSSYIAWTAPTAGTRFLQVTSWDGDGGRGRYWLNTSVVEPEFEPGDLDSDGDLDADDIDLLYSAINEGAEDPWFDLNSDSNVDAADVDILLDIMNATPGDVDLDGQILFADFLVLSRNFGRPGGWADGNFDGSDSIDFEDFLSLSRNFNVGVAASPAPAERISQLEAMLRFLGDDDEETQLAVL